MIKAVSKTDGCEISTDGESIEFIINPEAFDDEPLYKVFIPLGAGGACQCFIVQGKNEQDCLNAVVDYCENNRYIGLYTTFGALKEEELPEADYICTGNHGLYISAETRIEKIG